MASGLRDGVARACPGVEARLVSSGRADRHAAALEEGYRLEKGGNLDAALACYEEIAATAQDPAALSEAMRCQARVYHTRSSWDAALDAARRAASIASDANLHDAYAKALNAEALVHHARGAFDAAIGPLEEILSITDDFRLRGAALLNLGSIAAQLGDWPRARKRFHLATSCFRRAKDAVGEATALTNYGRAAIDHGNFVVAEPLLSDAVEAARAISDLDLLALATMNRAEAIAGLGNLSEARTMADEALEYFAAAGNTWRRVECLRILGDIAAKAGDRPAAAKLYDEARLLAREIGATREVELVESRRRELGEPV